MSFGSLLGKSPIQKGAHLNMRFYSVLPKTFFLLATLFGGSVALADRTCPGQKLHANASAAETFAVLLNKSNGLKDEKKQACLECIAGECVVALERKAQCDHSSYLFTVGTRGYLVQAAFAIGKEEYCTVNRSLDGRTYYGYINKKVKTSTTEATPKTRLCKATYEKVLMKENKQGIANVLRIGVEALTLMPEQMKSGSKIEAIENILAQLKDACKS